MSTVPYSDADNEARITARGPRLIVALSCTAPMRGDIADTSLDTRSVSLANTTDVPIVRNEYGLGAMQLGQGDDKSLVLKIPDPHMSSTHARLRLTTQGWHVYDMDSRNGTWVDGKQITNAAIGDGAVLALGSTIMVFRAEQDSMSASSHTRTEATELDVLRTFDPELDKVFDVARKVAQSRLSVLITGQTGTGKEVVARAIHQMSGRTGPFVPINCGAIPPGLVASELFGVVRGAFSGAHEDRPGLFQRAHGGTLFLDEIAELPLKSQVQLLRVLEQHCVTPVGGTSPIDVDVRVLAATHRSLPALVEQREFRRDLYARINGVTITLPALAERRADIGLLIARLLPAFADDRQITFTREAAEQLFIYHWPDNIRELRNVLQTACTLSPEDGMIRTYCLPDAIAHASPHKQHQVTTAPTAPAAIPLVRIQRGEPDTALRLQALYDQCQGNISAMARALQTSRTQVHRLLNRHQVNTDKSR